MAQKPKNLLEVLAQAGASGLGFVADNYLGQKQQEKQNAITGLMTGLQLQQAQQEQEQHRQRTLMNQQSMVMADLKISDAIKSMSKKPEVPKTPMEIAKETESFWSNFNTSGIAPGVRVETPYGSYSAPEIATPGVPSVNEKPPTDAEIRAIKNYQEGENRESIVASINDRYNSLPADVQEEAGLSAITSISDARKLLGYLDVNDSWFSSDRRDKYAPLIKELKQLISAHITGDFIDTIQEGISADDYLGTNK